MYATPAPFTADAALDLAWQHVVHTLGHSVRSAATEGRVFSPCQPCRDGHLILVAGDDSSGSRHGLAK